MSTPTTTTKSPTISRRVPSGTSSSPPLGRSSPSLRGGATARSAVSSRVTGGPLSTMARRASLRAAPPPPSVPMDTGKASPESLVEALKRETEEKEALLVKVQSHEQTISSASRENESLTTSLVAAESRLAEFYAEQTRMEEDMAARLEVIDKLRIQVKELEKEKRDSVRRYNEQTATFEAERQAFYDSEQHLKSRIQSLMQARKQQSPVVTLKDIPQESEDTEEDAPTDDQSGNKKSPQAETDPRTEDEATEPAEMTALKMELATLSTSHASIQNTLHLLQTQLNDFKSINKELQEENESYNILLRERTLSGQFDIIRATAIRSPDDDEGVDGSEETPVQKTFGSGNDDRPARPMSIKSRSTLDVVPEHDEVIPAIPNSLVQRDGSPSSRHSKRSRRQGNKTGSPVLRGESLGDLPITGPGLDLAAELGRAENKDISEGRLEPSKAMTAQMQQQNQPSVPPEYLEEVQHLKSEVKALKDANKALSLYASKIIDRIIAQEGFEHVLAADYEPSPNRTRGKAPAPANKAIKQEPPVASSSAAPSAPPAAAAPTPKPRPKSLFFGAAKSDPEESEAPAINHRAASTSDAVSEQVAPPMAATVSAPPATDSDKRARRGLSMDWKGISSFFGGGSSSIPPEPPKNDKLRPLTLKANAPITGQSSNARKIETVEDENDRRERERMLATMKLMGIETLAPTAGQGNQTPPQQNVTNLATTSPPPSSRVPFFTRFRSSEAVPQTPPPPLTTEVLEQAEAESTLAALDAREKAMTTEYYAKGKAPPSQFTELGEKVSLNRKMGSQRSASASGRSGRSVGGAGKTRMSADERDDLNDSPGAASLPRSGTPHSRTESVNTLFSAGPMD